MQCGVIVRGEGITKSLGTKNHVSECLFFVNALIRTVTSEFELRIRVVFARLGIDLAWDVPESDLELAWNGPQVDSTNSYMLPRSPLLLVHSSTQFCDKLPTL